MAGISIELHEAGKKYLRQWLFRKLSLHLQAGDRLAITGLNGSGKSTLLQILAGYVSLSEGKVLFTDNGKAIDPQDWYQHIAAATPYMELPEELSLRENLEFFAAHKKLRFANHLLCASIASLENYLDRPVKFFSSGMKQRLKLIMALSADVPLLILDEPVSNLDQNGVLWFRDLVSKLPKDIILVICSNHVEQETSLCTRIVNLSA